jgi:phytoene dehydrogenase-like protein
MAMTALVVGAGVIGLASARALAFEGHDVVVLEAADGIGTPKTLEKPCFALKAGAGFMLIAKAIRSHIENVKSLW